MCVLLLLLLGINCSLGLYRSNIRSPMERFRLRATATLLFIFAGMLMWIRDGPSLELAIVPVVGVIALVFGLWIEHLIGARLARSGHVSRSDRHSGHRRKQPRARPPVAESPGLWTSSHRIHR